jgi:hypothetical protein
MQNTSQTLYWARDPLGRRSLLCTKTAEGDMLLSSVSCPDTSITWEEVDASCVFSLQLGNGKVTIYNLHIVGLSAEHKNRPAGPYGMIASIARIRRMTRKSSNILSILLTRHSRESRICWLNRSTACRRRIPRSHKLCYSSKVSVSFIRQVPIAGCAIPERMLGGHSITL